MGIYRGPLYRLAHQKTRPWEERQGPGFGFWGATAIAENDDRLWVFLRSSVGVRASSELDQGAELSA